MSRRIVALACLLGCLLIGSSAFAFEVIKTSGGTTLKWAANKFPLAYYLDAQGAPGLSFADVEAAVKSSYTTWQNVECSSMAFEYKGVVDVTAADVATTTNYDGRNVVIWIDEDEYEGVWTDAFMLTVPIFEVMSGSILDTDILANNNFTWSASAEGVARRADIQNILTHEVGHLIGLDHPGNEIDATMYYAALEGETYKRTLAADDIQGVCFLYPTEGVTGSPCDSDNDCKEDRRCVDHEASGGKICSAQCECAPDCTAAFQCLNRQCLPPEPEIGGVGSSCSQQKPCGSSDLICVSGLCTTYCSSVADCPANWQCVPLMGGGKACYTENPDPVDNTSDSNVTITAFKTIPTSPAAPGSTITLDGTAEGDGDILYRFLTRPTGGDWTILKDYSTIKIAHWIADDPGLYDLKLEVKNSESSECFDDSKTIPFSISVAPDGDVTDGDVVDGDSTDGDTGIVPDDGGGCNGTSSPISMLMLLALAWIAMRRRAFNQ